MLDNYLDQLADRVENRPSHKIWGEWHSHPVTQWFKDYLESEYARLTSDKPASNLSLEGAGAWSVARSLVLDEIATIAAELEGPDEPERFEQENEDV